MSTYISLEQSRSIMSARLADAATKKFIDPSIFSRFYRHESHSSTKIRFNEELQKIIREYSSLGFQSFHIDEVYRNMYSLRNSSEVIIGVKEGPRQGEITTDPKNITSNKVYFPKVIKDFIRRKLKEFPDCTVFVHSFAIGQNAAQRAVAELNREGYKDRIKCVSIGAKSVSNEEFQKIALSLVQDNITSLVFREEWQEDYQTFTNVKLLDKPRKSLFDLLNLNSNYSYIDMVKAGEAARMAEIKKNPNSRPQTLNPKTLNIPAEDVNFSGISIDASGSYLLSTFESLNLPADSGITLRDFAVAVLIYYEESAIGENISNKKISLSLEPSDDSLTCEFKKIVFLPDNENLLHIVKNTSYFHDLLDCDLLMKSMSMDKGYNKGDRLPISDSLRKKGLKPIHEFGDLPPNFSVRLVLRISNIKAERRKSENLEKKCFIVNDILIEVIATELVRDQSSGLLKDVKIEDKNHPACLFAARFTELYPEISKEHSVFGRVKQIAKANTLAKWALANCIPISLEKARELLTKKIISSEIPKRINRLHNRICRSDGFVTIFGGINVEINSFYSFLEPELKLSYAIPATPDSLQLLITETYTEAPISGLVDFPFIDPKTCISCKDELSHLEARYADFGTYCKDHNSKICRICYKHIVGDPTLVENDNFHQKCITEEEEFRDAKRLQSEEEFIGLVTFNTRSIRRRAEVGRSENEARMEEAVRRVHDRVERIYSLEDCRLALEECVGIEEEAVSQLLNTSTRAIRRREMINSAKRDQNEFLSQLEEGDREKFRRIVDRGLPFKQIVKIYYQCDGDFEKIEQAAQAMEMLI